MRGQALLMAGAVAISAVTVAPMPAAAEQSRYQSYQSQDRECLKKKQNRMVAGGAIGAIAGAVLGSNVAGNGAKSEGGLLGALAGAVAGGAIGRTSAKCGPYSDTYNGPIGQNDQYGQYDPNYDDYGLQGGSYQSRDRRSYGQQTSYGGGRGSSYGRDCGYGEQVLYDPKGRSYTQKVYMCRGNDGVYRPE